MSETFRQLLGLKQVPEWAADGSWSLELHSLPQGLWALGAVALALAGIAGIWYLYRSEVTKVGLGMRLLLVSLRGLALACVALMLLELVLVVTKRESIASRLLVLVDTSQSMGLNDPYADNPPMSRAASGLGFENVAALGKQPRLEIARRALASSLAELARGRELSLYGFANQPLLLSQTEIDAAEAKGTQTAIGDALASLLAEHRGQPLAGILLLSDGQSNAGADPRPAAELAGKQGVPIIALAVGSDEGPSNARLAALEADPAVFVRDTVEVAVLVEAHGMAGRTGLVTLEKRQEAGWSEVGREEITFAEETASRRVPFKLTPEVIGELELRAHISELGPELTEADNFVTHSMKVIRQQIRVLLVAGGPSPEVQFLRNALLRDTGIEFACWLQSAGSGYEQMGTRPIRRLPENRQELEQYDVVVLFDPDMHALGAAWSELLSQFVGTAGGGLVYVAGEMHTRPLFDGVTSADSASGTQTIDNGWLRMLPVTADPGLYKTTAEVGLGTQDPFNLELTPEGSTDPIFQFDADPARNRDVLASLPGMYWHFPVTRAKPGATVLARHGDPRMRNSFGRHVLLAMHRYGPGRSVFLAFDSTYRWRYLHEEYFDGFWARLVDRVGRGKALGGRYPFTLSADKNVYRTGDRVTIRATAIDPGEGAGAVADLRGEVEIAGQQPTPLEMEANAEQPGGAETSFTANEAGTYSVRILPGNIPAGGDPAVRPATLTFKVETAHNELDRPRLDRALLEDITRSSGGRLLGLEDIDRLADAFKIRQVARTLEYRDELWDAPILFCALMCFLTLEWLLRKKSRMA